MRRCSAVSSARVPLLSFILAVSLLASAFPQNAGNGSRYALVIGNGSYAELGKLGKLGKLKNPPNDAADMAALKELGFKVELLTNTDLSRMETRLSGWGITWPSGRTQRGSSSTRVTGCSPEGRTT